MGKLACQLCICAAAVALFIQIIAIFQPFHYVNTLSVAGLIFRRPQVSTFIYWDHLLLKVYKLNTNGVGTSSLSEGEKDKLTRRTEKHIAEIEQYKLTSDWKNDVKEDCCPGKVDQRGCFQHCYRLPLQALAGHFNAVPTYIHAFLPDLPGGRLGSQVMLYAGYAVAIFTAFACISLILGIGYLYYYSEIKATKTARKGATVAFTAAPALGLLILLSNLMVSTFATGQTGGNPIAYLFASSSSAYPEKGFLLSLFNMLLLGMMLCFTRYWRMKRAERVRKQRKDEEEEEEFMQLMGIDRNGLDEDSSDESSDESTSDEEESDDEEVRPTQRYPAIIPSTGTVPQTYTMPMGQQMYSASYTVPMQQQVATQRIVIDPNQTGTQRIYL